MNLLTNKRVKHYFILLAILLVAVSWKIFLLAKDVIPFNSDEAIVALMARHILAGERPVFFYGQVYMGSLDAFLVAAGFSIFGESVWVIRMIQLLLYTGIIISTVAIADVGFGFPKTGLMAAALLAIPAVNTTLYTTASLGGYGEALFIGNLILLLSFFVCKDIEAQMYETKLWVEASLLGFLAGLGLWTNGLTLIYSGPVCVVMLVLLVQNWKKLGVKRVVYIVLIAATGVIVGAAPWWIYGVQIGGPALLQELMGEAVAVERTPWLVQTAHHAINYLLLGMTALLGFRPPWKVEWLGLPLLPFVLIFWIWVLWWTFQLIREKREGNHARWLLSGVAGVLTAGFLFTSFGVDPSGRYFVPLVILLALFAGDVLSRKISNPVYQAALLGLVVVFHGWGTWQCVQEYPPGLTTQFDEVTAIDHRYDQELITFLLEQGETMGYSNYWVSYPLAFLSQEELIFIPRLPYHQDMRYTARDDRYEPYQTLVQESPRVAYITTNHPVLDGYLRKSFEEYNVTWFEKQIGDYIVFYDLSAPVYVTEIGLGEYNP